MNVLIIDDEKRARRTLIEMLKMYCPDIKNITEAEGVKTGIEAIKKDKPDLILLDIQLNDGNGFDILNQIAESNIQIIFVTAFNDYAIKALRLSALDYLLKPIDPDEFSNAIKRFNEKKDTLKLQDRLNAFIQNLEEKKTKKLALKTTTNIYIVNSSDIIYCESDQNYTTFFLVNKQKILVSRSLSEYETILNDLEFIRTHQSYLVNNTHIISYEKGDGGYIITTNGYKIPVSTRKKEFVIQYLQKLL